MCSAPAATARFHTLGDTLMTTWPVNGFRAFRRNLISARNSPSQIPSKRARFCFLRALVISASVLNTRTSQRIRIGSLFFTSSTVSQSLAVLNLSLTLSRSSSELQPSMTFWSLAFLTLSTLDHLSLAFTTSLIWASSVLRGDHNRVQCGRLWAWPSDQKEFSVFFSIAKSY